MSEMRQPPCSLPLEVAILCATFLDPSVPDKCDFLLPEHFYSCANEEIWRSFLRLKARGITPDIVSVRDDLVAAGKLASVGGDDYLFQITTNLVDTHEPQKRANEIADLAQRRDLIRVCHEIASKGYDRKNEHKALLDEAESLIFKTTAGRKDEGGLSRMDARPILQRIRDISEGKVVAIGISTGVKSLDEKIRGLRKKKLYIVAGRPGMGKSSLAGVMSRSVSRAGKLACVFSQEMDNEEHDTRYLSGATGIPGSALETGVVRACDMDKMLRGAREMDDALVLRDETAGITLPKIRSRLRRALAENPGKELGVVIIDHIGLLRWAGPRQAGQSREQEVSEYAKALKVLSNEFDCAVVVMAPLNRECEKRPDKRPQLSDLRESGEIEGSADVVIFVYRRGYYAAQLKNGQAQKETRDWRGKPREPDPNEILAGDDDGKAEFIIAKGRGLATGSCFAKWDAECTRFVDFNHTDYRPDANVRSNEPHYTEGRPDDSDGDGAPFSDDDFDPDRSYPL